MSAKPTRAEALKLVGGLLRFASNPLAPEALNSTAVSIDAAGGVDAILAALSPAPLSETDIQAVYDAASDHKRDSIVDALAERGLAIVRVRP